MVEIHQDQENQGLGQEPPQPPPRAPRTHVNPEVIALLQDLPLYNKFAKNNEIMSKNADRVTRTLNHALDPIEHPVAGSPAASLITIDEQDASDLLDDTIYDHYKDVVPISIKKWIVDTKKANLGESISSKRSISDSAGDAVEKSIAKRRCMDGNDIAERVVGQPATIIFPQLLFDTEMSVAVPLPFFTHKSLLYITKNLGSIETTKANPLLGSTKGNQILDIKKVSEILGKELSLTCSQWGQAAWQMLKFQQERDTDGPSGKFSEWYRLHFNFFHTQVDKDDEYEAWKATELELREEFCSERKAFCPTHYAAVYALAKSEAKTLAKAEAKAEAAISLRLGTMFGSQGPSKSGERNSRGVGSYNGPGKFTRSATYSAPPFPSGSSKPSLPLCCILCGQRGHTVFAHGDESLPTKFSDGKPAWAKFSNRILRGPDNREICVMFNVKGERADCPHPKGERAHICSFCGKGHSAFSWSCKARPAPSNF